MSVTLYDAALQAVATAAGVKFPGATVGQFAFEASPEDLFGDPEKWPTATVPLIAIFDGPVVAKEPRPRGLSPGLYQDGSPEIVAWLHAASLDNLTVRARQTKRDLIQLIDEVATANPWSAASAWTLEWEVAEVKVSRQNTGYYVAVRVKFTVTFEE